MEIRRIDLNTGDVLQKITFPARATYSHLTHGQAAKYLHELDVDETGFWYTEVLPNPVDPPPADSINPGNARWLHVNTTLAGR